MPSARNDAETLAMFTPPLIQAMSVTAKLIYDANEGIVQEVVYNKGGAGAEGRAFDLKRAWDTKAYGGAGHATGEFKYNPGKIASHSSRVPGYGGVKGGLIDIVYHGLAGNFGWPPVGPAHASEDYRFAGKWWAGPRNAWAELCRFLGKRKIREFFEKGMASSGLKYISHGGAIGMEVYDNG